MVSAFSKNAWGIFVIAALTLGGCVPRPDRSETGFGVNLNGLSDTEVEGVEATLLKSATAAENAQQYARAAQFYKQAFDIEKNNPKHLIAYANNTRKAGDAENSISGYDGALILEPNNLDAQEGKALAYIQLGEFDRASALLSDILAKDNKRSSALNAAALVFVQKNMLPEAQTYLEEALRINPRSVSALNNLGLIQAIGGDVNTALDTLQKAARISPPKSRTLEQVALNTALVHALHGDIESANTIAERYLSGAMLDNNKGLYAQLANDKMLAKSYLNMALQGAPRHYPKAWQNLQAIE